MNKSYPAPPRLPTIRLGTIAMLAMLAILAMPEMAFASDEAGLPFIGFMTKLREQLSGPFAFSLSIIGIVAAGAMLIFGGDLTGFMRSIIFLVLVIAVIVGANTIVGFLGGNAGAVLDAGVHDAAMRFAAALT